MTRPDKTIAANATKAAQRPYPILSALISRNSLTEDVVRNIEALGYPKMAENVRKELEELPLLPWQKEVLKLIEKHPEIKDWLD